MLKLRKIGAYFFISLVLAIAAASNAASSSEAVWYEKDTNGEAVIHLYFFWSEKCPHCQKARPDIEEMSMDYPWLKLHSLELLRHPENIQTFVAMSELFHDEVRSVPTFMFCGNSISGYESNTTTGRLLRSYLEACYLYAKRNEPDNNAVFPLETGKLTTIDFPLLGNMSSDELSLPVLTIFVAGMDAFNPCAFFVLLFLLSMMVHGRSRKRMVLIGGIFVFFSGAIYFMFMAAWLNLFIYLGELRLITFVAGSVAGIIAVVNIKDYFWFRKGVSLTLSDSAKPVIFDRVRYLLRMESIWTVSLSTVVLAILANSYELLCTAGFPMVFTRILTLRELSTESYYLYLLLYNIIYILPLVAIVILFTVTLGSRKLSEHEGRVLKLLSGVMMLMLALLLVLAPQLLGNLITAVVILLMSVGVTWLVVKTTRS